MKKLLFLQIALLTLFSAPLFSVSEYYSEEDLVWCDDFNGSKLNPEFWNYETHEPGWVNNELQEYVESKENVYVKNGNLVIQAKKKIKNGKPYYTSGRVNTQHKKTFKYGRIEARIKFPEGQGFLPAFWMMPEDENLYGQWPKCGEIDIAEVLGHKTYEVYGTIHYGEPHNEQQGKFKQLGYDFAADYHVFACEWEPGEIRYYVDGEIYKIIRNWYSKKRGFGELTYPAPFDQPFYIIFNLAVGGNWPGNPDETTKFGKNAQLLVDYVKVYQKDSYDENVKKPKVKEIPFREPAADGNYVENSDFSVNENLFDSKAWGFLTAGSGGATPKIENNQLVIDTTNCGTVDHAVQVIHPDIPLKKGVKYQFSFDAMASENRTIIAAITAPNAGWARYFPDTRVDVGPTKKSFNFEFTMKEESDPKGRIEFNLGNQDSIAQVKISNVKFKALTPLTDVVEVKAMLPDGNYMYNAEFQEGENRLSNWQIVKNDKSSVYVTNENNIRELRIELTEENKSKPVKVIQEKLQLTPNTEFILSFDAYSPSNNEIEIKIANKTIKTKLTDNKVNYKYTFVPTAADVPAKIEIIATEKGVSFIDNIRLHENSLLLNGNFSGGLTSWEVYVNEGSRVYYAVDSLSEDNAFCIDIDKTGSMDWMIQLKQNNVVLEKGKKYKLQFDAKSTLPRTIMFALQRDGSSDDNWIPYSGTNKIEVSKDFQHYEVEFEMKERTDKKTILSISMGAVNDVQINKKHTVTLDNFVLEEVK